LTYTNTVSVSGCETDPLSYSDFLTAFVNGTGYTAINPLLVTFSNAGFAYDVFTFPGLIVTLLTPGEYITMVFHILVVITDFRYWLTVMKLLLGRNKPY
jgi:hypothetical protein